jgi:hypothetical protein
MGKRRSNQRGAISPVGMLLTAGLIAGVYFGIMYLPTIFENLEVKQLMREASTLAVRGQSDDAIRLFIQQKAKQVGSHYEIRDGQEMNFPGIVLLDDDIHINRDEDTKKIIIQVSYTVRLTYPFTQKQKEMTFSPAVKESYSPVVW